MSDTAADLCVRIAVRGDSENTPEEALHHALASLHRQGLIESWSEPVRGHECHFETATASQDDKNVTEPRSLTA